MTIMYWMFQGAIDFHEDLSSRITGIVSTMAGLFSLMLRVTSHYSIHQSISFSVECDEHVLEVPKCHIPQFGMPSVVDKKTRQFPLAFLPCHGPRLPLASML